MSIQCCAICAWRENCAKKFCVPDGGAHCPDFTRDVSLGGRISDSSAGRQAGQEEGGA